jgi:arylformamidase
MEPEAPMTIHDLTHLLTPDMPVYPGSEQPMIRQATTVAREGYAEKQFSMSSHTGTHIDAPAHMVEGAPTLDRLGAGHFVGPARVLDVAGRPEIDLALLQDRREELAGLDFILFHTGWSSRWGQDDYFTGFPVLTPEATRWLCGQGLKGVGFDAISADPVGSATFENHLALFRSGLVIIENLTGLAPLVGRPFTFSCLPLNFHEADGSPVRAVAMAAGGEVQGV